MLFRSLRRQGVRPVPTLPSWPGPNSRFIYPDDYTARADCVRRAMAAFAVTQRVPVIDLAPEMCPEGRGASVCTPTKTDGVHVDQPYAGPVLNWLLDETLIAAKAKQSAST